MADHQVDLSWLMDVDGELGNPFTLLTLLHSWKGDGVKTIGSEFSWLNQ